MMMRNILCILLVFTLSWQVKSQQSPNVVSTVTEFRKTMIVRLKSGTDLLAGLNEAVQREKITYGVIINGIGSVTGYHFHVVNDKNLPPGETYVKESLPMDVVSVQGFIFNGRVHAHVMFSDKDKVTGGHLEPGTTALTFLIITIGVLPDSANISRFDDYTFE